MQRIYTVDFFFFPHRFGLLFPLYFYTMLYKGDIDIISMSNSCCETREEGYFAFLSPKKRNI